MRRYIAAMQSVIGTREEQQDSMFCHVDEQRVIAAVCDGMGGLESGKLASMAVIEKLKELYKEKKADETFPSFFLKIVDILDELVFRMKSKIGEGASAGTTLTAAAIEGDDLFWLSIGDSRLYILRGDEFVQATRDHNYFLRLEQMLREKEIDERQYHVEALRGEALISFIGKGGIELMDINHSPFKLLPNDTILLTTDGLYKALSEEEIIDCLRMENVGEALNAMMKKACDKARQAQDNTTCVVIRYIEESENHETN